jgi:hypothetical protein
MFLPQPFLTWTCALHSSRLIACAIQLIYWKENERHTLLSVLYLHGMKMRAIQSLKCSTLPFFCSFSVRSPFIHRAITICSAFTKCSPFVHSSHYNSMREDFFFCEEMKKQRICKSGRMIKYSQPTLQQHSIYRHIQQTAKIYKL